MKVLITSGGTKVPIDDVRHIGNFSSGRYGSEIANAFAEKGAEVLFFHEKGSTAPKSSCNLVSYKYYDDYKSVVSLAKTYQPDIIISAAAVSDYTVSKTSGKISSNGELTLTLKPEQKILPEFKKVCPNAMVFGFKLLVDPSYAVVYNAVQKVLNNGSDYVVYNDLTELKMGISTRFAFDKKMNFTELADAKQLASFALEKYLHHVSPNIGY
jgi:phosphopantothenoylcysteine synthetase/decarboxylase